MNNPISIVFLLGAMSLLPFFVITTTSFIKIAIVCMLTRDSLGVQQIPPNIVIYCLSLIISIYVMLPVYNRTYNVFLQAAETNNNSAVEIIGNLGESSKEIKSFLKKHAEKMEIEFFYRSLQKLWNKDIASQVSRDDLIILIPAFMVSELNQAFKIGFLIYLPSIIIDLIISNILIAIGAMMMSPVTISLPIKLLLFISIDGWSRLVHLLLESYV